MKKLRTLGIVIAAILVFALGAVTAVLVIGLFNTEKPEDPAGEGLVVITPEEESALAWQQNPTEGRAVTVKTSAGEFVIRLSETPAADTFAANLSAYGGKTFGTVGDGFIMAEVASETFTAQPTELSPIPGAVGFAAENGSATLSLVIITDEAGDDIGENLIIFGQISDGADTLSAIIATGEGGYRVKEPAAIEKMIG